MSRLDGTEPISVRVGDCLCANSPHPDGDFVYLAPQLSLDGGLAANGVIASFSDDLPRLEKELGLSLVSAGVNGWNFLDDAGLPIPVTPENIRAALPWDRGGRLVAEEADGLYSQSVIAPLVARLLKPSRSGQTAPSSSPTPLHPAGPRKRSKRSSSTATASPSASSTGRRASR